MRSGITASMSVAIWVPGKYGGTLDSKDTQDGDICSECFGMGRISNSFDPVCPEIDELDTERPCLRCNEAGIEPEEELKLEDDELYISSGETFKTIQVCSACGRSVEPEPEEAVEEITTTGRGYVEFVSPTGKPILSFDCCDIRWSLAPQDGLMTGLSSVRIEEVFRFPGRQVVGTNVHLKVCIYGGPTIEGDACVSQYICSPILDDAMIAVFTSLLAVVPSEAQTPSAAD